MKCNGGEEGNVRGWGFGREVVKYLPLLSCVYSIYRIPVIDRQTKEKQADSNPPLGAAAKGTTPDITQSPKLSLATCN